MFNGLPQGIKFRGCKTFHFIFSLFISLHLPLFTIPSSTSFAQTTTMASPSASSNDFDAVCSSVLANSSNSNSDTSQSQKLQYCQAAQSSKDAISADSALWKVWAAVGSVCVAACFASFAGIGNQYVCIAADAAAGIGDAVITKNFMTAMIAIMSIAPAVMTNQMANQMTSSNAESKPQKAGEPPPKEPVQKDIGACLLGAQAAYQAFSRYSDMQVQTATEQSNLASAQAVSSNNTQTVNSNSNENSAPALPEGNTTTASGGSVKPVNTTTGGTNSLATPSKSTCSNMNQPGLVIQCAVASDSSVPRFVSSPRFPVDFKKASGLGLGDFFSKNDPPAKAMASAMSGTLSTDNSIKLAAALQNMDQQMHRDIPSSVYAGGGRGRRAGGNSGGGDPDLGNLMSIMGQFMPKQGEDPKPTSGISTVIFANEHRHPMTIAEDRTLNIFDRVTYRYSFVGRRMLGGEN